jgi:hypothetical protein
MLTLTSLAILSQHVLSPLTFPSLPCLVTWLHNSQSNTQVHVAIPRWFHTDVNPRGRMDKLGEQINHYLSCDLLGVPLLS